MNCMSLRITPAILLQHFSFAVLKRIIFFTIKRQASRLIFHGSFNNERTLVWTFRYNVIEQCVDECVSVVLYFQISRCVLTPYVTVTQQ